MNAPFDPSLVRQVQFSPDSGCNTTDEVILAQVAANIRRGLPQVQPHQPNPQTALLVCSGPSLKETERELVEAHWAGGKIVAVNGAYQWCIDRNLKPSAAIMLDAREPNARFIAEPVEGCKYLLASQCHPKAFEACADRETLIWHACSGGDAELEMISAYYFKRTCPVTIGTTVGIRAISLLRMLGFQTIDIFGLDSCWLDGEHHAFAQAENANDKRAEVWLAPQDRPDKAQKFSCSPWHLKQCEDFQQLVRERGNLFNLSVRGPGLIAAILRTGAEISMEQSS